MANEILRRNPTSAGNRRVFTWASWVKVNKPAVETNTIWYVASSGASEFNISINTSTGGLNVYDYSSSAYQYQYFTSRTLRDFSNWFHLIVAVDTTQTREDDRFKIYINGVLYNGTYSIAENVNGGINYQTRMNTPGEINYIGQNVAGGVNYSANCQLTDLFLVDGQALTPDIFGFHKDGKGYISVGSTSATDFRPGQWVPKSPRIIKAEINRRGGFGVNGFYLPMNSSNNFGADFHCTPDTILNLKENLPQPKAEIDGVGDYTGALRDDPFKQYLVLALPFVSGGLQNGFGDYSAAIKGSGSPKTITNSNTSITTVPSYYGTSSSFNGSSSYLVSDANVSDLNMGSGDYTIEAWVRFNELSIAKYRRFFSIGGQASEGLCWELVTGTNVLSAISMVGGNYNQINTSFVPVLNQWYHIAQVKRSGVHSIYVDGVCVGIDADSGGAINFTTSTRLVLGAWERTSGIDDRFTSMNMQDFRIYKGVAKYTGGFDVPRPYTPVGIATWRAVLDTTANNFCTWNPLSAFDGAQTNGNLTTTTNDMMGTIGINSGKWYWEIYDTTAVGGDGNVMHHGVSFGNCNRGIGGGFSNAPEGLLNIRMDGVNQSTSGTTITITSQTGTVPTYSNGDIYAIALDLDLGQVRHYRNGSVILTTNFTYNRNTYAIPYTRNNGLSCSANFGQNPTFSGNTTAGTFTDSNGKGLFKYQPPAGFLALCEDNLPKSTVEDPGKHFKAVLWTGNGSSRSISGVGFQPDLVWIKSRTNGAYFHNLVDSVRGPSRRLASNIPNAEDDASAGGATPILGSFDYDGFSLPNGNVNVNENNGSYIAWCWKAGNTTQTNTNGSITSTVSVNQTAGFSIVSWTGNGVEGATIGHGLNKAPKFIVQKNRDGGEAAWRIWHSYIGENYGLTGNHFLSFDAQALRYDSQRITGATATTFRTTGTASPYSNSSGTRFITYCWAEIEGFSKFGSYVGNGSADGPFVYCGFKPAWVMIKPDGANGWVIMDNARKSINPNGETIFANTTETEYTDITNRTVDFLSNGFKIRAVGSERNSSGVNYIFVAFAESPFQTANAK